MDHWILNPLFLWGVYYRLIGIIYVINFYDHYLHAVPFAGSRDQAINSLAAVGVAGGLGVTFGVLPWWSSVVCYLVEISFNIAIPTLVFFPFEVALAEAGLLSLFMPTPKNLLRELMAGSSLVEALSLNTMPVGALGLLHRLLLFRLMFGFGKLKFLYPGRKDLCFLKSHLVNQLSPTSLGYFLYFLPMWVFRGALFGMFVVEVINPLFLFTSNEWLNVIANLSFILLQIGITVTGNYSYFNVLTTAFSIGCIADSKRAFSEGVLSSMLDNPLLGALTVILCVGSVLYLPWWSWNNCAWIHWPFFTVAHNNPILEFYRFLHQYKIVNGYGVFPTYSSPPAKLTTILEGSNDGITWKKYRYFGIITGEKELPRYTSPQPLRYERYFDYNGRGQYSTDYHSSFATDGPHEHTNLSVTQTVMRRLLEQNNPIHKLFRKIPFPPTSPPKYIRASVYLFTPAPLQEYRKTGKVWNREYVGVLLPAISYESNNIAPLELMPCPELYHPDHVWWKKRSSLGAVMNQDGYQRVLMEPQTEHFWNEFVTTMKQFPDHSTDSLPAVMEAMFLKYGKQGMLGFQITFGRLTAALYPHLEPHLYQKKEPFLPIKTNFHLELLMHQVIMQGKEHYLAVIANPSLCIAHVPRVEQIRTSLFYAGLFKYEQTVLRCQASAVMCHYRYQELVPERHIKLIPGFLQVWLEMKNLENMRFGRLVLPEFEAPTTWNTWNIHWNRKKHL